MKFHNFEIEIGDTLYSALTDSAVTVKNVDSRYNLVKVVDERGRSHTITTDGQKNGTQSTGALFFWNKPAKVYPVPGYKHNNQLQAILEIVYNIFTTKL